MDLQHENLFSSRPVASGSVTRVLLLLHPAVAILERCGDCLLDQRLPLQISDFYQKLPSKGRLAGRHNLGTAGAPNNHVSLHEHECEVLRHN